MQILCFAGSLRKASLNKKYVQVAHGILSGIEGVETQYVDLTDYPLPVYNQEIDDSQFPVEAKALADMVRSSQALVVSSPENNGAIAAVTKNAVDWISRPNAGNPWPGKHVLLLGASTGALGAVRGLWHTRVPFEALGCHVYPDMSGLPRAHEAFDVNGALKEKTSLDRLVKLLTQFVAHVSGAPPSASRSS